MSEIKNTLGGITSKLDITEEKSSALGHKNRNYPKLKMKKKMNKTSERIIREVWDNPKQPSRMCN